MTDISRRGFLGGVAAAAAVAALPIPTPLPETYTMVFGLGPVFEGALGIYNGVIFRTAPFIHPLGITRILIEGGTVDGD